MFPATIEHYVRPRSVAEALAAVARFEAGDAIFLAGGQSAMQAIKSRLLRPRCIVDLQAIDELKGVVIADGALTIGAMTRYVEIASDTCLDGAFAALRDAAAHVGDRQVRNRGTLGGSVCWNYVAACMPTVVLALGGMLQLLAADGSRRALVADDFLLGPLETARRDDEILLSANWDAPAPRTGSAYAKWGLVTDALPVIGLAVRVSLDAEARCSHARIALAGLAQGAHRVAIGETALLGARGDLTEVDAVMRAVAENADTHADPSADADYRRQLIRTIGREVTLRAFARARGEV